MIRHFNPQEGDGAAAAAATAAEQSPTGATTTARPTVAAATTHRHAGRRGCAADGGHDRRSPGTQTAASVAADGRETAAGAEGGLPAGGFAPRETQDTEQELGVHPERAVAQQAAPREAALQEGDDQELHQEGDGDFFRRR
jgi:hypothetical protein